MNVKISSAKLKEVEAVANKWTADYWHGVLEVGIAQFEAKTPDLTGDAKKKAESALKRWKAAYEAGKPLVSKEYILGQIKKIKETKVKLAKAFAFAQKQRLRLLEL